jgi:hypothetical protein
MSKYLSQTTEVYRVSSEAEAARLIEEAKSDKRFTLLKSSTEYKTVKVKGNIEDEYWKTTLVKHFTDLKEPDCSVSVTYTVEDGYFPEVSNNED